MVWLERFHTAVCGARGGWAIWGFANQESMTAISEVGRAAQAQTGIRCSCYSGCSGESRSQGLSLQIAARARTSQPSHQAPMIQVPFGHSWGEWGQREEGSLEMTRSLRYNRLKEGWKCFPEWKQRDMCLESRGELSV